MSDHYQHDVCTGTLYFVPQTVYSNRLLFHKIPVPNDKNILVNGGVFEWRATCLFDQFLATLGLRSIQYYYNKWHNFITFLHTFTTYPFMGNGPPTQFIDGTHDPEIRYHAVTALNSAQYLFMFVNRTKIWHIKVYVGIYKICQMSA